MKYSNSLKYMIGFPKSNDISELSVKRVRGLCERLGRINIGSKYICLPSGASGYASAVMLESVIAAAGHSVGRITSAPGFESRSFISVNLAQPSIDDYNNSVAELKSAVRRSPDEGYLREETAFVLGLLLCKMSGCEYVILQGFSEVKHSLADVCAPYDLIVVPTVYEKDGGDAVVSMCDAVRKGTREVVSGNQKSEIYNVLSNACAVSGVRLYIPIKSSFKIEQVNARNIAFSYGDREGFSMKTPSWLLRDVAMTVIEAALALRRSGTKLPWRNIADGIAESVGTACFELLSISPLIIIDSASEPSEIELMANTAKEIFGSTSLDGAVFCISDAVKSNLSFWGDDRELIVFSEQEGEANAFNSTHKCAKDVVKQMKSGKNVICFGSVEFALEMKQEIIRIIN